MVLLQLMVNPPSKDFKGGLKFGLFKDPKGANANKISTE
jgi:hypothetical protein